MERTSDDIDEPGLMVNLFAANDEVEIIKNPFSIASRRYLFAFDWLDVRRCVWATAWAVCHTCGCGWSKGIGCGGDAVCYRGDEGWPSGDGFEIDTCW